MATTKRPQKKQALPKNKKTPRKAGRVFRKPKGKTSRVRLELDERRTQLLDLGIDLFSKHGYDDISIDSLAEEAGISKGLLYHYFGSKREYYVATVKAASLHLQRLTVPDPSLPPAARLAAAVDKHLRYVDEHRAVFVAMYRSGAAVAPEVSKIIEAHRDVVMRYFSEGIGVSAPRPMLRTSLRAWIAMVEGASLDWISNPAVTRDQLRDLLVAGYVAMLAKTFELDPETAQAISRPTRAS